MGKVLEKISTGYTRADEKINSAAKTSAQIAGKYTKIAFSYLGRGLNTAGEYLITKPARAIVQKSPVAIRDTVGNIGVAGIVGGTICGAIGSAIPGVGTVAGAGVGAALFGGTMVGVGIERASKKVLSKFKRSK